MTAFAARHSRFLQDLVRDPVVAWVISHPAVTSAIIGARNLDQLNDALGCVDIDLTPGQRAEITALSIDPPLATDRENPKIALDMLGKKG